MGTPVRSNSVFRWFLHAAPHAGLLECVTYTPPAKALLLIPAPSPPLCGVTVSCIFLCRRRNGMMCPRLRRALLAPWLGERTDSGQSRHAATNNVQRNITVKIAGPSICLSWRFVAVVVLLLLLYSGILLISATQVSVVSFDIENADKGKVNADATVDDIPCSWFAIQAPASTALTLSWPGGGNDLCLGSTARRGSTSDDNVRVATLVVIL